MIWKIVNLIALPIMILNALAGIASFIWLLVLGQWPIAVLGALVLALAPLPIGLVLLGGLAFGLPAIALVNKKYYAMAFPFALLAQLYTFAIMTTWSFTVIRYGLHITSNTNYVPMLLGMYSVCIGPWAYLGEKEMSADPNSAAVFSVIALQMGLLANRLVFLCAGLVVLFFDVRTNCNSDCHSNSPNHSYFQH